jgi:hypothetical protein
MIVQLELREEKLTDNYKVLETMNDCPIKKCLPELPISSLPIFAPNLQNFRPQIRKRESNRLRRPPS